MLTHISTKNTECIWEDYATLLSDISTKIFLFLRWEFHHCKTLRQNLLEGCKNIRSTKFYICRSRASSCSTENLLNWFTSRLLYFMADRMSHTPKIYVAICLERRTHGLNYLKITFAYEPTNLYLSWPCYWYCLFFISAMHTDYIREMMEGEKVEF